MSCARNLAFGAAHESRGTIAGIANQAPAKCSVGEIIAPSRRSDSLVSPVFDIIGTVLGRVRISPKVIVSTIRCSRRVLSPGRKTHFSSEKLPFHSRAGWNSWVSLPCMPAADDCDGPRGRGVTGPILRAAVASSPAGAMGRSPGECGRNDPVSGQASCRGESESTSDRRLSRLIDAAGRMAAERA